jgi:hypothetical protein
MSGAQPRNTMGIQAQIPSSSGGGVRSSPSTETSGPKCLASLLGHPESLWAGSMIYKVYKALSAFQFTEHMAIRTDFLRLIHVRRIDRVGRPGANVIILGFNQIDLPQYSSYEMLRQQLLLSINEGGEGFGFA